jgi:PPOX class probable F420-dependent enzyme
MPAPVTELDARYSEPEAAATGWEDALAELATAELSWISTVRRDGRPHVTPLITVVHDGTVYFCTGPEEQKGRNLAANPSVAMTTGRNDLHGGLDLVVEGTAERVTDDDLLHTLADSYVAKYGEEWRFDVGDGVFRHTDDVGGAWVFAVRARTAYGFGKEPYSHTRWTF